MLRLSSFKVPTHREEQASKVKRTAKYFLRQLSKSGQPELANLSKTKIRAQQAEGPRLADDMPRNIKTTKQYIVHMTDGLTEAQKSHFTYWKDFRRTHWHWDVHLEKNISLVSKWTGRAAGDHDISFSYTACSARRCSDTEHREFITPTATTRVPTINSPTAKPN